MAVSKFDYVRHFEQVDSVLLNTYIVVRVDGKGFSKFTQAHNFKKPNDKQVRKKLFRTGLPREKNLK